MIMWQQLRLRLMIYRYRALLSSVLLFAIGYFAIFSWLALPPLTLFLGWHPDTQLTVLPAIEPPYRQYVQPGDIVLDIDGRPARRGDLIFSPPIKPVYTFTLQRDGDVLVQEIVVGESRLYQVWRVSQTVLSLLIWFLGFLTAQFARLEQMTTVIVGLSFQLIAAGIISPGPAQLGAPGAWLVGQALIFYFPQIMLYLSFLPRYTPLNPRVRKLLKGSFLLLTGMALLATLEQIFLFPDRSLFDIVGIRGQTLLTLLTGGSVIGAIGILLVRFLQLPKRSYERQQLTILFVFLTLAVTPLFLFVILPVDQTVIFAPFPLIYSFFLLAPAGYFFVLHRQGYLELDGLFSRIVTIVTLILAAAIAYTTGIYLGSVIFHFDNNALPHTIFGLTLLGVAVVGQKPVQTYVDLLVYGHGLPDHELLQEARASLSSAPEPATVTLVLKHIAAYLQVQQAVIFVRNEDRYKWLAGTDAPCVNLLTAPDQAVCLRSRSSDRLVNLPDWVELSLRIAARGDRLGLLLLSRPVNGYFNGKQVKLLQNIADTLSFSLLVISLVEAMNDLSQRALYEKEIQRQQIATEIHNGALHDLTNLLMQLQRQEAENTIHNTVQTIRQVTYDLRRIASGLRPPSMKHGLIWMIRQVVCGFEENQAHIIVSLVMDVRSERSASDLTKMVSYYILTEALNNISKHARASEVNVFVGHDERELILTIQDNGIGPGGAIFPLTDLLRKHHLGVVDMYRWASVGGGKLEIRENRGGGTIVNLVLPVDVPSSSAIIS